MWRSLGLLPHLQWVSCRRLAYLWTTPHPPPPDSPEALRRRRMPRLLVRLLGIGRASCVFPGVSGGLGGWANLQTCGWGGGVSRDLFKHGTTRRRSQINRRLDGSQGRTWEGCDGCSLYGKVNVTPVRWLKFMTLGGGGEVGGGAQGVQTGEGFRTLPQPLTLRQFGCFLLRLPPSGCYRRRIRRSRGGVFLVCAWLWGKWVVCSSAACGDLSYCSVELVLKMVKENKKKTPTSSNETFRFGQFT